MARSLVLLPLVALTLAAQFPGQYPPGYPGGRYPGGGYPGGPIPTGPIPVPGRRPPTSTPPETRRNPRQSQRDSSMVTTTYGILRRVSPNQVVIEAEDHRIVWYRLGDKMEIFRDGKAAQLESFGLGDTVSVDSTSNEQGEFTASSITWRQAATAADKEAAARTYDLPRLGSAAPQASPTAARRGEDDRPILRRKNDPEPPRPAEQAKAPAVEPEPDVDNRPATTIRPDDPAPEADDPGKPVLRRGKPQPSRRASASASGGAGSSAGPIVTTPAPAPEAAVITQTDDPVIEKAREAAAAYSEVLPNFFARQVTTRYQTENAKRGWNPVDVVTADIAYEDGMESYTNIKMGNKAVNRSMEEIDGTHSTGEFASIAANLLSPASGALFRRRGQDTIRDRGAWLYDWEIPRERSSWRIEAPSQLYYPAMKGSVWIDKETSRVLRIEQQGRGLPALFPFDTVETTTDYDYVRLGTPQQFLLPVEAEVLTCQRGTSYCSRNRIEFRNYRKFGSESEITFDDPKDSQAK